MTYSYARRAWALEHFSRGYLGRETIAAGCGVPPRTLGNWLRDSYGKGPGLMKTPREYERALGILLYDRFPNERPSVAKLLHTKVRTIQEWRTQVRMPHFDSELLAATRLAMAILNPSIDEYFYSSGGEVHLLKERPPDSLLLEELIWQVYDDILNRIIDDIDLRRLNRQWARSAPRLAQGLGEDLQARPYIAISFPGTPSRLNGPHKYRGAVVCDDGDFQLEKQRRPIDSMDETLAELSLRLKNRGEFQLARENLDVTLSSPLKPLAIKQLKIKYASRWQKWSIFDAYVHYVSLVHPLFRR